MELCLIFSSNWETAFRQEPETVPNNFSGSPTISIFGLLQEFFRQQIFNEFWFEKKV